MHPSTGRRGREGKGWNEVEARVECGLGRQKQGRGEGGRRAHRGIGGEWKGLGSMYGDEICKSNQTLHNTIVSRYNEAGQNRQHFLIIRT